MDACVIEFLAVFAAYGIIYCDENALCFVFADGQAESENLPRYCRRVPRRGAQKAIKVRPMPRKQAGEDNVCNPQPAVKVGENANKNAEIAKTGSGKQGLERVKENVPIGRRFLVYVRHLLAELSDYTKSVSPLSIFAKHQYTPQGKVFRIFSRRYQQKGERSNPKSKI